MKSCQIECLSEEIPLLENPNAYFFYEMPPTSRKMIYQLQDESIFNYRSIKQIAFRPFFSGFQYMIEVVYLRAMENNQI